MYKLLIGMTVHVSLSNFTITISDVSVALRRNIVDRSRKHSSTARVSVYVQVLLFRCYVNK